MARRITHPNSFPEIIHGIADLVVDAAVLSRTLTFRGTPKAMASRRAAIYHYRTSLRAFLQKPSNDPRNAALAERLRPQLSALELISMEIREADGGDAYLYILFPGSPESRYADELTEIQKMRDQLRAEAQDAFPSHEELSAPTSHDPLEDLPLIEEESDEEELHSTNVRRFLEPASRESLLSEAEQKHVNNVMSQLGIKKER